MHNRIARTCRSILETTKAIREHRTKDEILWGDDSYSPEDTERMILDAQLALANIRKRQRDRMELTLLVEASATPL